MASLLSAQSLVQGPLRNPISSPAPPTLRMQFCFLACLREARCENIFINFVEVVWLEKPPPPRCTLLGELKDPSTGCKPGNGTLIKKLAGGRRVEGDS